MSAPELANIRSQARALLGDQGFIPADELRAIIRQFVDASEGLAGRDKPGTANTAALMSRPSEREHRRLLQRIDELEQALLRQETELSYSQQIARMGSWSYDLSTNEIWWSQEMCRLFGFEAGETELDFAQFFERLHPEDRDSWLRAVEEASKAGHEYEIHFRALLADGTIRHLLGKGLADLGEDGGVWRVFGTVQELNEALAPSSGKETGDSAAAPSPSSSTSENVLAGKRPSVPVRAGRIGGAAASAGPVGGARGRIQLASAKGGGSRASIPPAPSAAAPEGDSAPGTPSPVTAQVAPVQPSPPLTKPVGSTPGPGDAAFNNIHSSIGMWELDLHSGALHWSSALPNILNLPEDTAPSMEKLLALFTDASRKEFENALQRTVISGEGFFMQVGLVPVPSVPDVPRLVLVSARLHGAKGDSGEFKLLGTIQNVTGWAQA